MGAMLGKREDGTKEIVRVDQSGRVSVTADFAAPVWVQSVPGSVAGSTPLSGVAQTQDVSWSKSITGSSQDAELPEKDGVYLLAARGNDAFIETADGSAPTVTASAGGFSIPIFDGKPITLRLAGDYIAWIGAVAGGTLSIIHIQGA